MAQSGREADGHFRDAVKAATSRRKPQYQPDPQA